MAYLKPQSPLRDKKSGDFFYPLTTSDQVILDNGNRLSGSNFLSIEKSGSAEGEIALNNADTLGGKTEDELFVAKAVDSDKLGGKTESELSVANSKSADSLGGYTAEKFVLAENFTSLENKIPFTFGIDKNGNYGYIKAGADSVTPFNRDISEFDILLHKVVNTGSDAVNSSYVTYSYSLTSSDIAKYQFYLFEASFIGVNNISYGQISSATVPSNAINILDGEFIGQGSSVSGSNGSMDTAKKIFLIPKQNTTSKISVKGRGFAIINLVGFY